MVVSFASRDGEYDETMLSGEGGGMVTEKEVKTEKSERNQEN